MELLNASLIDWSRAQFALTAMYHWIFVPLTLGLGVLMSIYETLYYRTGKEEWKNVAKFWMTIFGINFAIGVATGIILEFQFGTNWSNYSWFVGDIFGAPLAIEGILAFFMEATFISIMFFGWNKVSKGWHLASTWLTVTGATLSALWILVANAWMQYPIGMEFNPSTVRNEMIDFWSILLSPVAVNKFIHTVISSWVVGSLFVVGISTWYLIKRRDVEFAKKSIKVATIFGFVATVLVALTGHESAYHVAKKQPMKLAAMEGLYHGGKGVDLVAVGILNPSRTKADFDSKADPYLVAIKIPKGLSFLADFDFNAYIPGVADLIKGGYEKPDGTVALSFEEMQRRGKIAREALKNYQIAEKVDDKVGMAENEVILKENFPYFGYSYLDNAEDLIPSVPMTFYSFHIMVSLGMLFLLIFLLIGYFNHKDQLADKKWLLWLGLLSLPLGYIASQAGWIVAEVGRQPWAIQDILPVQAAISSLEVSSVKITVFLFAVLFTGLLIAELRIMYNQIKKGPESEK